MNAYERAQELGLAGTDEEIVAALQAIGANDIPIIATATWLRENRLWIEAPDGATGALVDVYSTTDSPAVKAGLADFYAAIFRGQASTFRLTDPVIASRVASVLQVIRAVVPNGNQVSDALYMLAGGRPFASLTTEQFSADRDEVAARTARSNSLVRAENALKAAQAEYRRAGCTPESIVEAAAQVLR